MAPEMTGRSYCALRTALRGLLVHATGRRPRQSSHVVLYSARSKILRLQDSSETPDAHSDEEALDICPLCRQAVPPKARSKRRRSSPSLPLPSSSSRYFGLLSESHAPSPASSRPASPPPGPRADETFNEETLATGFYARFFEEERLLGRGARGAVYLCRHVLHGEVLAQYAVKKISVGDSVASLLTSLKEIRHLQHLRHKNIVAYHHCWLEGSAVSKSAPVVPCLFVLLDFCNMGSLATFIQGRMGSPPFEETESKAARIRRFKRQHSQQFAESGAIHFLRLDEILKLFRDVCEALAFLHANSVFHLDLKIDNVLLHLEPEDLMPSALLSDFGSAEECTALWNRQRTGFTGTIDFVCPEAFKVDPQTGHLHRLSAQADLWALGLVLHQLCFFCLPYRQLNDVDLLREEIENYQGFQIENDHGRHDLPFWLLRLISRLLSIDPMARPSAASVLAQLSANEVSTPQTSDLVQVRPRRHSFASAVQLLPDKSRVSAKNTPEQSLRMSRAQILGVLIVLKLLLFGSIPPALLHLFFALGLAEISLCRLDVFAAVSLFETISCLSLKALQHSK